jgi:hypothetical protein
MDNLRTLPLFDRRITPRGDAEIRQLQNDTNKRIERSSALLDELKVLEAELLREPKKGGVARDVP